MRRFWYLAVILAITLAVSGCQGKAQPQNPAAQVLVGAVTGEAQFQHTNEGEKQPLTVGQALVESDIVTSGAGALIVITLEEGKEIHIGENTIFALSAIRRDADGNVNILALKQGSIVNIVDTPLEENDVYEVHTPRLVMSVRGTSNYMETNAQGDTVIGITGETHIFSDTGSANVVAGMRAEMNPQTPSPKLSPLASRAMPKLASNYAKGRDISFGAITQDDIAQAQRGANEHKPSDRFANEFSGRLFQDDSVSAPDSKAESTASSSSVASSEAAESASSEQESESTAASAPPITETAVSSTAPVQTAPAAQTPSSSTASSVSSKAESSSSTSSSGSRNNESYTTGTSSSGSGSRNNDSYTSSKSSSSTPAPSSSTPAPSSSSTPTPPPPTSPTSATITVLYKDCFNGTEIGNDTITLQGDGTFELNVSDLTKLQNEDEWYLSSASTSVKLGNHGGNSFPMEFSGDATVSVYIFESKASAIVLSFYITGEGYKGATHLNIPFSSLFTADGVNLTTATTAVQNVLSPYGGNIVGGQISLNMLYLVDKTNPPPAGYEAAHSTGFELWIPVTAFNISGN